MPIQEKASSGFVATLYLSSLKLFKSYMVTSTSFDNMNDHVGTKELFMGKGNSIHLQVMDWSFAWMLLQDRSSLQRN